MSILIQITITNMKPKMKENETKFKFCCAQNLKLPQLFQFHQFSEKIRSCLT